MPIGMMGDAITVEKMQTGVDNTATYTGFMTLGNKLSQSVALLLIGVLLDIIGFQEGSPTQTVGVEWGLGWILFIGILASLICGFVFFTKYSLKKSDIPNGDDDVEQRPNEVTIGDQTDLEV